MHPAYSIIFFTTASGAGYGLLFFLGIGTAAGAVPGDRWFGLVGLLLALALVSAGLLSSTFHLGHPERAWRALTQWRSSWLSREGVLAVLTYLPALALGFGWVVLERPAGAWGVLTALFALATVVCTAMIYASLKPIRQWHNRWVVPGYLGFSLVTGALWLNALLALFGAGGAGWRVTTILLIIVVWTVKSVYWREVATEPPQATAESATGLGHIGPVRLLDPPHTQPNYLSREMGYRVAQRHADRLRRFAVVFGGVVPVGLVPLVGLLPAPLDVVVAMVAALSGSLGVVIERWLFFAEARHTVTLYYGAEAA
ncbi:MAG: dimethyl sulfoxide reductase anchor subunit [Inquilinus sp.]|nr:dimethyl sulfoxide reductase anchor subunit [Inquilinus sp.]